MKCHGVGRLTKDPELRSVGDSQVCSFSLAMDRSYGKGENRKTETSFFDCELWGGGAKVISDYCKKGNQLFVDGEAIQDRWDDKTTGQKRSKIKFRVNDFTLLNNRKNNETNEATPATPAKPVESAPF